MAKQRTLVHIRLRAPGQRVVHLVIHLSQRPQGHLGDAPRQTQRSKVWRIIKKRRSSNFGVSFYNMSFHFYTVTGSSSMLSVIASLSCFDASPFSIQGLIWSQSYCSNANATINHTIIIISDILVIMFDCQNINPQKKNFTRNNTE